MSASKRTTEDIWSDLGSDLRRFIRRRVPDDHLAEDLLQETFLRIHAGLSSLRKEDRLAAWVYRIARNVIHDHHRKVSPEVSLAVEPPAEEDTSRMLRDRAGSWLDELVDRLPERYREAVRWSEIDGLSGEEIARRLGLSSSGAKSRVQRGRAKLKTLLEACCSFHFDRRGRLMDCEPKPTRTVCRDCDE